MMAPGQVVEDTVEQVLGQALAPQSHLRQQAWPRYHLPRVSMDRDSASTFGQLQVHLYYWIFVLHLAALR